MASDANAFLRRVEELAEQDNRYKKEVFFFVYASLEYTVSHLEKRRHVSGPELLRGISEFGRKQFGPLTKTVFEHWGTRTTLDFGHIVFLLVDAGLMGKTPEDRLEDFTDVYDFDEEFDWKKRRGDRKLPKKF